MVTVPAGLVGVCARPARAAMAAPLPERLRRGFNLPDQAPLRAERVPRRETLQALRKLGMSHVRLPVVGEFLLPAFSGPATISATLDDVNRVVDMLLSLGYAVTVDMHPGSDLGALIARDPAHAQRALADGWRQLAKQLLRWPSEFVFAELLNEPPMPDALWRSMARALIEEARGVAASHYLIVGPAPYQRPDALLAWEPFADSRIVYACHYYSPMVFTHQGADWEKGSPWAKAAGVPFPTHRDDPELIKLARQARSSGNDALAQELGQMAQQNCNAESIDAEFEALAAWSARTGAPVIINEFGVLKRNVKREHRLAWLSATRRAAESHGFGWAHWDYASDFGLLDRSGALDEGAIRALLSP
ncbi:endoglucanase [freshwater sediment metagenome]|uniref:Endoglucanase n=1 Tax=freshwater sediment metagenome TaxID=556182 RepID=A0AA48LZ84_9ZZZZ